MIDLEQNLSRRELILGGLKKGAALVAIISVGSTLLSACEPMDTEGDPTPAPPAPGPKTAAGRSIHQALLNELKLGKEVEILEGTFTIDPGVNRRYGSPGSKVNGEWYKGVDYSYLLRSEVVRNPLGSISKYGLWEARESFKYLQNGPYTGSMTYFSPKHGLAVFVLIQPGDTDTMIRRSDGKNNIQIRNLKPATVEKMQQKVVIEDVKVDEKDPYKRLIVRARWQDGRVDRIVDSALIPILGIF